MMLLPNVPDFCTAHRDFAKVHQIIAARGTLLKKEACDGTKSGTVTLAPTRRHGNPPGGIMPNQSFFPLRSVLLLPSNRKGIIAFACNDDCGKPSTMEPFAQRLRDKPGVHGQGNLREINTFTIKCSFQT